MNNLKYLNSVLRSLIIVSIIPTLILGPFIPDLIVSLSSLVFLVVVFKNKLFFYFTKKPLIIFFIFCIYCILVSIFVAEDIRLSFKSSFFYFRIGVLGCLIWYLIEQDKKILNYCYYALVISFSFLIVDGYIQFFSNTNIIGLPKMGDRISSFFGDELIMGSYLSRLFPLIFALFVIKEKKNIYESYSVGIVFILTDILIYISGERAAFVLFNISTIFIIILIREYQKFRLVTFIVAFFFIGSITYFDDDIRKRMINTTLEQMGLTSNSKNSIFTPEHDSLIRTAYNMFLDKPLVGQGPKMFRVICKDEKYATGITPCMTHPHNFYVQLLAETGVIGFSFLFSVFVYLLYCAYRQFKSMFLRQKRYLSDYQVCLLAGILITVWPITTNGNFFNNWLMIMYSLPLGFYLHSIYGKNKEKG